MLSLTRGESGLALRGRVQDRRGNTVEPWVGLLEAIHHATDHLEQIKSMLTAFGLTPPSIDGWDYGEFTGADS